MSRPDAATQYLDVLVGERVYERVRWEPDTDEIVFFYSRAEPLRMPFGYIKRWRPRESLHIKGHTPWQDGPRAFTIKPHQPLIRRRNPRK